MTNEKIMEAVTQIVSAQMDTLNYYDEERPALRHDATLADLGLDELSAVEVLMHVEEVFRIELADDEVVLSSTVDSIAKLVAWHLRNKEHREMLAPQIRDTWLDFPND